MCVNRMTMAFSTFWLVSTIAALVAGPIQDAPPVAPTWELARGPYYAGQGIEARIRTVAGGTKPVVAVPTFPGADVVLLPGVEVRPLTASAIGNTVARINEYRIPVRIVPRQSGRVVIPALKIEADGREQVLPSRSLTILAPPNVGRPATFLGGIGRIDAVAEIRPISVRVGDAFEYRIRLEGPGSIGSTGRPNVSGLDRLGLGLRLDPLAPEVAVDPPSRTLRFRVRASVAGSRSLPPFLVSWLDPISRTYMTTASRAVSIRVVDVPEFRPGDLDLPATRSGRGSWTLWMIALGLGGLIVATGLITWARRRATTRRHAHPRTLATELIRRLERVDDAGTLPLEANRSLVEFLERIAGRTPGVLTPGDASAWVAAMGGTEALAASSARLIAICDRTLYGASPGDATGEELRTLAIAVLRDLGNRPGGEKPREAPGTA